MKATAKAGSNIAFVKYWGKSDEQLKLPMNGSISMTLDKLFTITTVEFSPRFKKDSFNIDGRLQNLVHGRVAEHIGRIRRLSGTDDFCRVMSKNNFPSSTGLSSSASGFAALTVAASKAAGLNLDKMQLTILSRKASGSSCRSIYGGFVEWLKGESDTTSYAVQLHDASFWDLCDVVAIVSKDRKKISSTEGQRSALSNPFFIKRLEHVERRISDCRRHLKKKDFHSLGKLIENEALELHSIMLTSDPNLLYMTPESLMTIKAVQEMRDKGIEAYFSLNTGQDVHIICEKKTVPRLEKELENLKIVKRIIVNHPGKGARLIQEHLF